MADSVIIVGSGHIGLACARYLREDGYEVTVIDQGAIADGCSRGNCGFIVPSHVLPLTTPGAIGDGLTSLFNSRAPFRIKPQARGDLVRWMFEFARRCTHRRMLEAAGVLHTLLEASNEEFHTLLADARLACEWQQQGILFVFRTESALGEFAEEDALLSREFGVAARYLDSANLAEFEPALLDGLAGGYYYEGDSHLRPDRFNASLAAALQEDGVRLMEHCGVDSVEKDGEAIVSLETSQGPMRADHYVFATGAWSSQFAAALDCNIPVEPGKGYAVTMTCPDTMPSHPMLMPESRIGVTPFESDYRIASMMEFAGFDSSIPDYRIRQLQDSARPYLKDPVGPSTEETWYGWRPMTWDSLPIIGRLPKLSNGLIATGHNMLGLTLAPITGRLIADQVSERQSVIPIDAFSPNRFN
jgi:D-amino-acid dehydrogenase